MGQNVGVGTSDPTEKLDVDGNLRLRSGAQQDYLLQSDSFGVANWTHPDSLAIKQRATLCVSDFGANGDGIQDDAPAFQAAMDSALKLGGKVCVPYGYYRINSTLTIHSGVILEGFGLGTNGLSTPYNGSVLAYFGTGFCLNIIGQNSGVRDLVVLDRSMDQAKGGILLSTHTSFVESNLLFNIFIYGFTAGTALRLSALNSHGIAYNSFYDIRIRHARVGIQIEEDLTSFANSNQFFGGAITRGGYDYGLKVNGGNNNIFYATTVECAQSDSGHIGIYNGNISMHDIRLEAQSQSDTVPILYTASSTLDSRINGLFAGGVIRDWGDNDIELRSSLRSSYNDK